MTHNLLREGSGPEALAGAGRAESPAAPPRRDESTGSRLFQTAFFALRGLTRLLDWYLLYPIAAVIFSGLAKKLALLAGEVAGKQ